MIVVVPAATPETMPVEEPTVATLVAELAHVPPVGVLDSVVVAPTQTVAVPAIAEGSALTVTKAEVWQPVASV